MNLNNLLLVVVLIVFPGCASGPQGQSGEIFFADPTIFVENGKYYLTGNKKPGAFGVCYT